MSTDRRTRKRIAALEKESRKLKRERDQLTSAIDRMSQGDGTWREVVHAASGVRRPRGPYKARFG